MRVGCISVIRHKERYLGVECVKGRGIIFPGGTHEPHETYIETAIRELYEETGLRINDMVHFYSAPAGAESYCYAFAPYNAFMKIGELEDHIVDYNKHLSPLTGGPIGLYPRKDFLQSNFRNYYEIMFQAYDFKTTVYARLRSNQ